MKLSNGWLQRAYTAHKCDSGRKQIFEQKSQIIRAEFASYATLQAERTEDVCFFTNEADLVREKA